MAKKTEAKKKRLISFDSGYDMCKVSWIDNDGLMQVDKFPSAVCKLPNPAEIDDENNGQVFRIGPDWWAVGETALKCPKSLLMPLETFEDMLAVYVPLCSYVANKYGNGFDSFDHFIIGVSVCFQDKVNTLISHLMTSLNMTSDKEDYFVCLPQGVSAKYCYFQYGLNPSSQTEKSKTRMNDFLIADIGGLTIDLSLVLQGSSSTGIKLGLSNVGGNVISYQLCDYVYQNYGFQISFKTAQVIVKGDNVLVRRGREIDLSDVIKQLKKNYIKDVLNLFEDKLGEMIDSISGILLVGGGAMIFKEMYNDPDVEKEIEKHFSKNFIKIPEMPEYYNVIAYLKIGEKFIEEDNNITK